MVTPLEKPKVKVFQVFEELSPTIARPVLEGCVVGVCNQVINEGTAGTYNNALITLSYPSLLAQSTVTTSTVEVLLSTTVGDFDITNESEVTIGATSVTIAGSLVPSLTLINDQIIASITAGTSLVDSGEDYFADGIRTGDIVRFVTGAAAAAALGVNPSVNTGDFVVLDVVDQTTLTLDSALTAETNVAYDIVRQGPSTGTVKISYIARRADGVGLLYEFSDITEMEASLGPAIPENPLALGMSIAISNTDRLVAATMVENDSVSDHLAALDFLETVDVYALNPLTQNTAIHSIYASHVTNMSLATNGKERVVFINNTFADSTVYQALSSTGVAGGTPGNIFTDVNGQFVTNEVPVGAIIELTGTPGSVDVGGTPTTELQVLAVNSETEIETVEFVDSEVSGLSYTIESGTFSRPQIARNIADRAASFANRRVFDVWPDTVTISTETTAGVTTTASVPGYYIGSAIAGLTSALSAAQGFTNLPLAGGFTELLHSNDYFSEQNLNIIAGGGVWIVTQATPEAQVETRHQLSTKVDTVQEREYNITKQVDYFAKFVRTRVSPLIGRNNITVDFINGTLRPMLSAVIRDAIEEGNAGSATRVTRISQVEGEPDTLAVTIDFDPLFPLNTLEITLLV